MNSDKKINITYLVSRLRRQGPFFQLYNIIKCLDHSRFHPRIITLSPEAPDSLMDDFKREGVDCLSLSLSRKTDIFLGPKKLKNIFRADIRSYVMDNFSDDEINKKLIL